MYLSFLLLLSVKCVFSAGTANQFVVVSTTEPLPANGQTLSQTEQLSELKQEIAEIKTTLKSLAGSSQFKKQRPKNCKEVLENGNHQTGIYSIHPEFAPRPFLVLCDMESEGGGWTSFLNRFDGSQSFDLKYDDYKKGFGNLAKEFWLGLEHLHQLTGYEPNEPLIKLKDWDSKEVSARFTHFAIGGDHEGYFMKSLGEYSGDAGDSFSFLSGMKFSTEDRDQDIWDEDNCAKLRSGGWWYRDCARSILTGLYSKVKGKEFSSMYWTTFRGGEYSLKEAKMMVRPRSTNK